MKKLILITAIFFAIAQNVYSQTCGCLKVKNFSSVCNSTAKGRQFIVSLSVESATGDSVEIISNNGSINGSTTFKQKHTPPTTDFQFTFNETNILSYFDFTVNIKSGGRVICSETRRSDLLADCGKDCGASWVNINTPPQCTHPDGVSKLNNKDTILGIHGGISAGAGKVTSYITKITDIQRRQLCSGQPAGAWQSALSLMPIATAAEMGSNYATSITATSVNGGGFNSASDYYLFLKLPAKIISRQPCAEEFKITMSITVTFENGCTKTINHTVSYLAK